MGQLQNREYNGKTYYTLRTDFAALPLWHSENAPSREGSAEAAFPSAGDSFAELTEDDGELPF